MKLNTVLTVLLSIAIHANAFEKITGLNRCLPSNIKIENIGYDKGNWEIIKLIDTTKVVKNRILSISLCFISEDNPNNIFSNDTSRYTEFDKYDSTVIFKVNDNYSFNKNIDYLLFVYSIRSALNCYYKVDKPIGPGYGNSD